MLRIKLVLLVICLFVASSTFGHGGTVSGKVKDVATGEAIPYATVHIEGTSIGGAANEHGLFQLDNITPGQHTVIVSCLGYRTVTRVVQVTKDHDVTQVFALADTPLEAGGMVVTGTRTQRYIKEVPVFTQVITRASIEDKSAHNIFEALSGEPGVRVEQQCQACNFSILRMQGLGADHTQVLLDGQPVYSGLASVYGLQQLSMADVDRIEIVKGAGSALYGSNAVAGAINIISAIPRTTEGRIRIEVGDHGTNEYEVTASTRKQDMGIFLFAQQSDRDEIDESGDAYAPAGVDEPDGWTDRVRSNARNAGFSVFLDNVISTDQLILRGHVMSELRQGGYLTDDLFENPFAAGSERIITDRHTAQLDYRVWFPRGNEIGLAVALTHHDRNATNDTFLGDYEEANGEAPPVNMLRPYIANERLLVASLNVVEPLSQQHRLLAGVQLARNDLEESGMYLDTDVYTSVSKKEATEVGVYFQDEVQLTDRLEVVGGFRFDWHTSVDNFRGSGHVFPQGLEPLEYDEMTVNPRLAVKYDATPKLVLRGTVGTGFRVPYGFSEDLHLCSGSPRVYKGGNLKPEKSRSYSVSADYTEAAWNASISLYHTKLDDAIAFAEADEGIADLGYTYQWKNINRAFVMGAEFSGSYALTPDLAAGVRWEYFKGEYADPREDWVGTEFERASKKISRYPETSGGLKLEYTPSSWGYVLDVDYKGKMYIDLTEPTDPADVKIHETESFVILNAKISRTFLNRYKLYAGARNLTGYMQEEKHVNDAAFLYAPVYGRIVIAGLQVTL